MRNAWCAMTLAVIACGVSDADTSVGSVSEPLYAAETDRAIDSAIQAGRATAKGAEHAYQASLVTLKQRDDAADRVVARAEQADRVSRVAYLGLLGHVGSDADGSREYLTRVALKQPPPVVPTQHSPGQHDSYETDYERSLGESFAAVFALVQRRDTHALQDIYANADLNVAAVAAASAARAGFLDQAARSTLNSRGIGGTFEPVGDLTLPGAELGSNPVDQPMVEGPQ